MAEFREEKMVQRTVPYRGIAAKSLLSVAILMSVAHLNAAQAQKNRAAAVDCGNELQKHCTGVGVSGNNTLECLQRDQNTLSKRCAAVANVIVRSCERDAMQRCRGNVAGEGSILSCLTSARRSVSARCNAALDAAFLRR